MPQFFHRRWSTLSRLIFFGAPLYLIAVIGLVAATANSPYNTRVGVSVRQPVAFSHEHHVGRLNMDCRYCHSTAERSAFAGMPSTDVCVNCHSRIWTGHGEVEPVLASFETGIPLAWRRVHDLPDFAYFHHGIHVQKGIACVTCHGRVDQMAVIRKTETLRMQWCLECHREPEKFVRPREAVYQMTWRPPEDPQELAELGRALQLDPLPTTSHQLGLALVEKYNIQRSTSCSHCHY